jgi:hypothetical protein
MSNLITYKIVKDQNDRLKTAARTACNFWNHYIVPQSHIVINVGLYTADDDTIAGSYKPEISKEVTYGQVDFNTKYLDKYNAVEVAGTITHEIGHTLGFGWNKWTTLFRHTTGRFKPAAVTQLAALKKMYVETNFDEETRFSHWDEAKHDRELMTGFEDRAEFVLPVTIDVMALLGHKVATRLKERTAIEVLMNEAARKAFTRHRLARQIDREHFRATELWEKIAVA